ncbi:hypothetical protein FUAX_38550 (plasmid) [Fulvitalea axinellae]|uniref:Uncharacterized protein n=1 Tax=Fulvitalea axinellae TaxID=1182444 RepID=A0AAU9D5X9_9BACT|nr:hypothetical protein FUAX_38550 [Fulvitalea axinellae]
MLEHQKVVLKAVSDDALLFEKELMKSLNWLNDMEQEEFKKWVRARFGQLYPFLIEQIC